MVRYDQGPVLYQRSNKLFRKGAPKMNKRQPMDWKIFAKYVSDKELTPKT